MITRERRREIIKLMKDAWDVVFAAVAIASMVIPGALDYWLPQGFTQ